MQDGRVMIAGGGLDNSLPIQPVYESANIFDPKTETFTSVHAAFNRWNGIAKVLDSGAVVVIGGHIGPTCWYPPPGIGYNCGLATEIYVP
jgi:hypothetical protein